MKYGKTAAFGVCAMTIAIVLLVFAHPVFADNYEKNQPISQVNECGNYWFPVNIICSNLNPKIEGDENTDAMASASSDSEAIESKTNYVTPFP